MLVRIACMVLVSAWVLAFDNAALAQIPDWKAAPRYETVNLVADSLNEPYQIDIEAGGSGSVDGLGPACVGYIDFSKPDVDLNYEAGDVTLGIHAVAPEDLTLVILDPDGEWFCNDDYQGSNPGIEFERPKSGNYNIWVGTYTADILVEAALVVREQAATASALVTQGSVNFGDNKSTFARDGECDDDRFVGRGMASTFIDADRFHDADDCLALYERGDIRLKTETGGTTVASGDINFGDNQSQYAYDNECDDDRFAGPGVDEILLEEDRHHDAADCQALYERGVIHLKGDSDAAVTAGPVDGDFGDNTSKYAYDRECDDDRFIGRGMADILIEEDRGHDAADCRQLFEQGEIDWKSASTGGPGIDFGDNQSGRAYDGTCDDDRFSGYGVANSLDPANRFHDADDCQALYDRGNLTLIAPSNPSNSSNPFGGSNSSSSSSSVDFGDDGSKYANDGECDDDRFTGQGMASSFIDADRFHDASDCRRLFEQGNIRLKGSSGSSSGTIDFGDNRSNFANDGECDDDRFVGQGMASSFIDADRYHDANDCRVLFEQGYIELQASAGGSSGAVNFGDNRSKYAHDGECDDDRFVGQGMASSFIDADRYHDAADCQALYDQGNIRLR